MSQPLAGANRTKGRLVHSFATPALALTAIAGGLLLSGGEAKAANCDTPPNFQGFTYVQGTGFTPPQTLNCTSVFPKTAVLDSQMELNNVSGPNPITGSTFFMLSSTDTLGPFLNARLAVDTDLGFQGSVTKVVCATQFDTSGNCTPANTLVELTSTGAPTALVPLSNQTLKTIYVKDTYTVPVGNNVDRYTNTFQTPGPLPVLGAGAAFGFSRKLRSRIKATKQA